MTTKTTASADAPQGVIDRVECSFSLLDEGRKYTGNHRKYVIENAREICYAPETREKIRLREALGYYGHGGRQLTGKMDLSELDVARTPSGNEVLVTNIPACVTTAFEIDRKGTVTHTQEILDSDTGRIVQGLNRSRVGGFSWACPGTDGGRSGKTTLTGFAGFDYVLNPGFSTNRGYVLEGAGDAERLVLEAVMSVVGDEGRARAIADAWRSEMPPDPSEALFQAQAAVADLDAVRRRLEAEKAALEKRLSDTRDDFDRATADLLAARARAEDERKERESAIVSQNAALRQSAMDADARTRAVLEGVRRCAGFFIPGDVMDAMERGDFSAARGIFETASHVDFDAYPVDGAEGRRTHAMLPAHERQERPDDGRDDFGSSAWGWKIRL